MLIAFVSLHSSQTFVKAHQKSESSFVLVGIGVLVYQGIGKVLPNIFILLFSFFFYEILVVLFTSVMM